MNRQKGQLNLPVRTTTDHPRINVMTMGEPGVGKSCLIKRFCEEKVNRPIRKGILNINDLFGKFMNMEG